MKIAIVTITRGENYGNRLQNYALQHYLEKNNSTTETIHNHCGENRLMNFLKKILKHSIFYIKFREKLKREKNFKNFNCKNIKFSKYHLNNNTKNTKAINDYDFFICGSDQIWNPSYDENDKLNFLADIPNEKSIAYAPSFGVSEIPYQKQGKIKEYLLKIKNISIREEAGRKIIEDLTGRTDVEVLVDPTMLLTAEEWDKVSKKPQMLKTDKYILNYFLGNLSDEKNKEINRIAKENNCEVINILDKNSPFYECGPSEFLWLEKHAFLICTDSFHSSVFAIIYNRPFIIFDREQDGLVSMNSRLDTLLSKFKLKDRKFDKKITESNLNHNYSEAYKILEEERKKSKEFLEKALDIK